MPNVASCTTSAQKVSFVRQICFTHAVDDFCIIIFAFAYIREAMLIIIFVADISLPRFRLMST